MDKESYYRRWLERSWLETKSVWTSYRWWLSASAPVASLLLLVTRQGWRSLMHASDVLINATGGAVVAFLGSLLISAIRSPKLLDQKRKIECDSAIQVQIVLFNDLDRHKTTEIAELKNAHVAEIERCSAETAGMNNALARCREELALKHPADAAQEQMVQSATARLDGPELQFVKWLASVGSADNADISRAGHHDTVPNRVIGKTAPVNLIKRIAYTPGNGLVEMGFRCEINPELKTALRNVLFR